MPEVEHRATSRTIRTVPALAGAGLLGGGDPAEIDAVAARYAISITPAVRERIGAAGDGPGGLLGEADLAGALGYIRDHSEVWEVILTDGDPLLLSPERMRRIIRELDGIEHVGVIRIHTRVPVVAPERITADMIEGRSLVRQLRGPVSGLCQPTYMLDIPGGHGKVPIAESHLDRDRDGYLVTAPNGEVHRYAPATATATAPATATDSAVR